MELKEIFEKLNKFFEAKNITALDKFIVCKAIEEEAWQDLIDKLDTEQENEEEDVLDLEEEPEDEFAPEEPEDEFDNPPEPPKKKKSLIKKPNIKIKGRK